MRPPLLLGRPTLLNSLAILFFLHTFFGSLVICTTEIIDEIA